MKVKKTQQAVPVVSAAKAVNLVTPSQQNGSASIASSGVNTQAANAVGSSAVTDTKAATGFRLKLQLMLAGIQNAIPDGSVLTGLGNQPLAKADIVQQLAADLAQFTAVDTSATGLVQQRAQLEAAEAAMRTYYAMLKGTLEVVFGKGSPLLAQFGLSTKSPKPLNPAQRLVRAEKLRQTRLLRNTEGPKQKAAKQFTGTVAVTTSVSGTVATPATVAAGSVAVTPPQVPAAATPASPAVADPSVPSGGSPPVGK